MRMPALPSGVSKARSVLPTRLKNQGALVPSASWVLWYLPQISPLLVYEDGGVVHLVAYALGEPEDEAGL